MLEVNPFFKRIPIEHCPKQELPYIKLLNQFHVSAKGVFNTNRHPERIVMDDWVFETGEHNAITDVKGVKVGHLSVLMDDPHQIRTGVTTILPHSGNIATLGNMASAATLNGFGDVAGMQIIEETGILNSPIVLTSTFMMGAAKEGVFQFYDKHYPSEWPSFLPFVGECYDGFFNTVEDRNALNPNDVLLALEYAEEGPVVQGSVGAGTGMRAFELKAGIGSASRKVTIAGKEYTIGVLLNCNHSLLSALNTELANKLENSLGNLKDLSLLDDAQAAARAKPIFSRQGSVVTVIATDIPLLPQQLNALCKRAVIGIGNVGSVMDTTSGDFAIAFSTANPVEMYASENPVLNTDYIHPDLLTPAYRAVAEAVAEAQINSIIASH